MIKSIIGMCLVMLTTGCGTGQKGKADQEDKAPKSNPVAASTTEMAILRAPIGSDGEPILENAELRTQITAKDLSATDLADAFASAGVATDAKAVESVDELDRDTSTQSWYVLPWRARVANGYPVRRGPYLLPWRRAVANGYAPSGGYLSPYRQHVSNSYGYYTYTYTYSAPHSTYSSYN